MTIETNSFWTICLGLLIWGLFISDYWFETSSFETYLFETTCTWGQFVCDLSIWNHIHLRPYSFQTTFIWDNIHFGSHSFETTFILDHLHLRPSYFETRFILHHVSRADVLIFGASPFNDLLSNFFAVDLKFPKVTLGLKFRVFQGYSFPIQGEQLCIINVGLLVP